MLQQPGSEKDSTPLRVISSNKRAPEFTRAPTVFGNFSEKHAQVIANQANSQLAQQQFRAKKPQSYNQSDFSAPQSVNNNNQGAISITQKFDYYNQ